MPVPTSSLPELLPKSIPSGLPASAAHHWPHLQTTPQSTMNTITPNPVPTPHPSLLIPFRDEFTASQATSKRFATCDPDTARKAYHAKKAEWAKLDLHQDWADEAFMRDHIKAAGLKVANNTEPATVSRLKSLLRSVGIHGPEVLDSVGSTLQGFLSLNPGLPLWAAVALILEATGRFTPQQGVQQSAKVAL